MSEEKTAEEKVDDGLAVEIKDFDGTGTILRVSPQDYDKDTTEKPKFEELGDGSGDLLYTGTKSTADTVSKKDTADPEAETAETVVDDDGNSPYDSMTKAELIEHAKLKGIDEKQAKGMSKDELVAKVK